jgi:hypothetical protein
MPQLVKGGKWVFGWVVVGEGGWINVPPEAWDEYGYCLGDEIVFIRGSRTSGGFSAARAERLTDSPLSASSRILARGSIRQEKRIDLPPELSVRPGDRLLVARGSGLALGFFNKGPILEEALNHPELEVF